MPTIDAHPLNTLVDENVSICVNGLESLQKVTLRSSCHNDTKDLYESFAFYKCDKGGNLNLLEHRAMYGGCYEGVEPMGLFWSMSESKLNKKKHVRMVKKYVEAPVDVEIEVYDDWKTLEELRGESPITDTHLYRWYKKENVTRVPVRSGSIRGTLFLPPGDDKRKAVIDMFGGAGGLFEFRASMLASHGFLVLSLAIYAYDDLPAMVEEIQLEYFEEAVQFMQSHPRSIKGGVGVIGTSFGSDIALCMATYVPGISCCICVNGGNLALTTPFTFRGFRIPLLYSTTENFILFEEDTFMTKNVTNFPESKDYVNHNSLMEFHKSNATILFVGSEEDGCYPMPYVHRLSKFLLKQYQGGSGSYEFAMYPGAGHLLELPNTPLTTYTYYAHLKCFMYYGGEIKQHARAQEKSWGKIIDFFTKNIIKNPQSKL